MKMLSLISFFILAFGISGCQNKPAPVTGQTNKMETQEISPTDTATFGAGCFWCVEAVYQELEGVISVTSGYSGGKVPSPTYKEVCSGLTGHAEVTQIVFDPARVSFETLLEVFWTTHDPTTLNRQGNDVGTQYRSVIFYHNPEQKRLAEKSKREVAPQLWDNPIVTEISPYATFYPAEQYHQDFYSNNPDYGYCRVIINPKVAKLREKFADKLKK